MDKHLRAHAELHEALLDVIDAIELIEGVLVTDEAFRTGLTRKLTRAKMLLSEARQDMRWSRIGGRGVDGRPVV